MKTQEDTNLIPDLRLGTSQSERHRRERTWIAQLTAWKADGTLARLSAARIAKQPVQVKRTDGSISIGRLHETCGFGGRMMTIEFDTPKGKRYRHEKTEDFLELNPGFGPALQHLSEKP